ncbi:MAG: hypothetical protein HYX38_21870 [Rhodospirillales bacterium]|nr:hypothetical protein [Rhodospirillales bacterium]
MTKIEVDMNLREDVFTIVVPLQLVSEFQLKVGDRVLLYEPGTECEAILRHGKQWPWVADIVEGTIRDTSPA